MSLEPVRYRPIGVIHSPFSQPKDAPIQPRYAGGAEGTVVLDPEYTDGLSDLAGFSHVVLLYHLHLSEGYSLKVTPYMDDQLRGLFATRAPRRPNPIGLSVVRLERVEENIIYVRDIDAVDGTPLLDIKPYVPEFGAEEEIRIGWLADRIKPPDRGRQE